MCNVAHFKVYHTTNNGLRHLTNNCSCVVFFILLNMYYYTYQRKFFFIKTAGRRVIFARMLNVLKDVYEKVFETTKAVSALFVTSWYLELHTATTVCSRFQATGRHAAFKTLLWTHEWIMTSKIIKTGSTYNEWPSVLTDWKNCIFFKAVKFSIQHSLKPLLSKQYAGYNANANSVNNLKW